MNALYAAITAFVVTFCGVPLARRVAFAHGLIARPAPDRWHSEPTPLLGGAAIALGFFAAVIVFARDPKWLNGGEPYPLLLAAGTMALVGLIDDAINLPPRAKLLCQIAATAILAVRGPRFDLFRYAPVNIGVTWFWLLAATNAVNFVDGVDGLASGVGIFASAAVAAIALLHGHMLLAAWALALAGSLGAFLFYNRSPASIFMGDAGALTVGVVLGMLSIAASHSEEGSWPTRLILPVLLMMAPLLDITTVTVTRIATGNRVSRRGLDHSHHRLSRLGLSDRAVCAVMYAVQAVAGLCAIALSLLPGYTAVIAIPFIGLGFALLGLFFMDRSFDSKAPGELRDLPLPARLILNLGYKRRLVEAVLDAMVIAAAYFAAVLLRIDFALTPPRVTAMLVSMIWIVPIAYGAFFVAGVYRGIWRYTGLDDGVRLGAGSALAGLGMIAASRVAPLYASGSIACLYAILLFNLLLGARLSFRIFARVARRIARAGTRTVVAGAGDVAETAARLFERGAAGARLVGFVDDDRFKRGKVIHGYPVLGAVSELERIFSEVPFDEILLAQDKLSDLQLRSIRRFAESHRLRLRRFVAATIAIIEPAARAENVGEQAASALRAV